MPLTTTLVVTICSVMVTCERGAVCAVIVSVRPLNTVRELTRTVSGNVTGCLLPIGIACVVGVRRGGVVGGAALFAGTDGVFVGMGMVGVLVGVVVGTNVSPRVGTLVGVLGDVGEAVGVSVGTSVADGVLVGVGLEVEVVVAVDDGSGVDVGAGVNCVSGCTDRLSNWAVFHWPLTHPVPRPIIPLAYVLSSTLATKVPSMEA